jgi:hypothetical protein
MFILSEVYRGLNALSVRIGHAEREIAEYNVFDIQSRDIFSLTGISIA